MLIYFVEEDDLNDFQIIEILHLE